MMLTLAQLRRPFTKFHQAYHFLPVPWKFMIWVMFTGAMVGVFCGVLIGIGKLSDNLGTIILENGGNQTGISLLGHVYNIDIPSRTVQISWLIIGCGDLQLYKTYTYNVETCGRLNVATDFYVDGSFTPSGSYNPDTNPYIQLNKTTTLLTYVQALNQFQTTHLIEISSWDGLDQQYAYPFDTYFLDSSVIAREPHTNESLPILTYYPVDITNNFSPYVEQDWSTITFANGTTSSSRFMRIQFRRTAFTIFFVMSLFFVNWALTGVVLYITLCANEGMDVGESILLLPLSVIVTIPALRAMWVGAPAFGLLLDSCGLFLQMFIVALCSIFLVVNVGLSSPQERELRKTKHSRMISESECFTMSEPEWKETHGLKAAQEIEMAMS